MTVAKSHMKWIVFFWWLILCVCVYPEVVEEPFSQADLLSTLKKMLDDPVGAVEVKFSTLGLICSLANSSK